MRRRREIAAIPAKPHPSNTKEAGSGAEELALPQLESPVAATHTSSTPSWSGSWRAKNERVVVPVELKPPIEKNT